MAADTELLVLARWVLWGGLCIGIVLGVVGQSTRFCVRGAIADWVGSRHPGRLLGWLLAVAVAAVSVQALVAFGAFDARRTLGWSQSLPRLSYTTGGLLFGFGMMLGGGCPQRNLVKSGAGDLRALVTLLVTAVAALMTLRGAFAPWRAYGLDDVAVALDTPQDIGSLLTGHVGFVAEHPQTLEPAWVGTQTRRPEGLSFIAPLASELDLLTLWTDRSTVATFGVTPCLGLLLGSIASARVRGEWRLQGFANPRELALHLAGGVLMGFGGITALGCTLGNGVTGLALLSFGAVLVTAGIVGGALLAMRLRLHQEASARGLHSSTA